MAISPPDLAPPGAGASATGDHDRGVRAWPVLGSVVLGGTLLLALVPAVRAQAELSVTRQGSDYLELYAVALDETFVGTTCGPADGPGTTAVTFSVASHLDDVAAVVYEVGVQTSAGPEGRFGEPVTEQLRLSPGEVATRTVELGIPTGRAHDILVVLPATGQNLRLHCGRAR